MPLYPPPAAAATPSILVTKLAKKTNGSFGTANVGTTFTVIDSALDLTFPVVAAGNVVTIGVSLFVDRPGGDVHFDVGTLVSGAIVNRVAGGTEGIMSLFANETVSVRGACVAYTVQAGDLTAGVLVLRLLYNGAVAGQTIRATVNDPLSFSAILSP